MNSFPLSVSMDVSGWDSVDLPSTFGTFSFIPNHWYFIEGVSLGVPKNYIANAMAQDGWNISVYDKSIANQLPADVPPAQSLFGSTDRSSALYTSNIFTLGSWSNPVSKVVPWSDFALLYHFTPQAIWTSDTAPKLSLPPNPSPQERSDSTPYLVLGGLGVAALAWFSMKKKR